MLLLCNAALMLHFRKGLSPLMRSMSKPWNPNAKHHAHWCKSQRLSQRRSCDPCVHLSRIGRTAGACMRFRLWRLCQRIPMSLVSTAHGSRAGTSSSRWTSQRTAVWATFSDRYYKRLRPSHRHMLFSSFAIRYKTVDIPAACVRTPSELQMDGTQPARCMQVQEEGLVLPDALVWQVLWEVAQVSHSPSPLKYA